MPACRHLLAAALAQLFHQPSWVTLAWFGLRIPGLQWTSCALLVSACEFEVELRLGVLVALLVHEAAHFAAASLVVPLTVLQCVRFHFPGLAQSLVPLAPVCTSCIYFPDEASVPARADQFVKVSGLCASLVFPILIVGLHPDVSIAVLLGTSIPLAGAVLSDLPSGPLLGPRPPLGFFCCGNWGLLMAREALQDRVGRSNSKGLLPAACEALLKSVLNIVELRGAQAGGCLTFVGARGGQVEAVRSRTVKSKRGHLGSMLFQRFRWEMRRRRLAQLFRLDSLRGLPVILVQGHSRFGTSSSPAVIETHPHQWLGRHVEKVWRCNEKGQWSSRKETVCTTITHNGDYDGSVLYDSTIPNGLLGEWLTRVLHVRNSAKGDSPKLAGMMDLFICQGMWAASVRCAFVCKILHHVDEAFGWEVAGENAPNIVPRPAIFAQWAMAFEDAFERRTAGGDVLLPTPENIDALASDAAASLAENRLNMSEKALKVFQRWGLMGATLLNFCKEVALLFFERDVLSSVWYFFTGAVGTFSVSVSCSLWPNSIVMAAKGQPISIAFDSDNSLAFWSSEPNSLDVPSAWKKAASASKRVAAARWDMDDAQGEVIELRATSFFSPPPEALLGVLPGHNPEATFFSLPGGSGGKKSSRIVIRGMNLGREPTALDCQAFKNRWVRLRAPPPAIVAAGQGDPIATDIRDVPAVIAELEDSWTDPAALNYMSGNKFARSLQDLMYNTTERNGDPRDLDVLIFGIENSLWLAQQFAADLSRLFPSLNITAMSSNWVLGLLQKAHGQIEPLNFALPRERFAFKRGAIALAVSHSGTTYPTVWCARLLAERPENLKLFAMSGVLESVLANSVGQDQTKNEFSGTLFSTMAGVRPSEPSTVATLAMHHSFSLLLVMCANVMANAGWEKEISKKRLASLIAPGPIEMPAETPPSPPAEHNAGTVSWLSGFSSASTAATTAAPETADACVGTSDSSPPSAPPCSLSTGDVSDLRRIVGAFLPAAEQLCGVTRQRQPLPSQSREELKRLGDYFSQQLLEVWYSTLFAALYVYITVTFGVPLFSYSWTMVKDLFLEGVTWEHFDIETDTILEYVIAFLDAHLYVFLAAIAATVHRLATRRRLFTRYTNRTIVIVDSTANYKLLRAYVSKLGALAFRFTSFGVAGQNGSDHFVHEMTHKTTSEVILFVGRPDGRLGTLAAAERSVVLSIQQARFVASRSNTGIEMVSLGHNPWKKDGLCVCDMALPTTYRPDFLSSVLLHSGRGPQDPLDVCHRLAMMGGDNLAPTSHADFRWVSKERAQQEMSSQQSVNLEEACWIIQKLVEEHSEALGIGTQVFDIHRVLQFGDGFCPSPQPQSPAHKRMKAIPDLKAIPEAFSAKKSEVGVKKSDRGDSFTASDIVAILRGRAMAEEIRSLQRAELHQHVGRNEPLDLNVECLREVFECWVTFAKDPTLRAQRWRARLERRRSRVGGPAAVQQLPMAEWRVQEEYRRRRRQWLTSFKTSKFGTRACFTAWQSAVCRDRDRRQRKTSITASSPMKSYVRSPVKAYAVEHSPSKEYMMKRDGTGSFNGVSFFHSHSQDSKNARVVSPPAFQQTVSGQSLNDRNDEEEKSAPIGGRRLGRISTHEDLVAQLALMERLYETRTAAAERLLASFIIFHHAVRPLSRLWGLSFDMDRSESRLRVASTPAPVPFVEKFETKKVVANRVYDI